MKKLLLLTALAGMLPLTLAAQDDDLYFVPKKQAKTVVSRQENRTEMNAVYPGCNRDIDEYNRRGQFKSSFQKVGTDSLGNDVIEFHVGTGEYPDSAEMSCQDASADKRYSSEDDYAYSRQMSRFDGYFGLGYYPWYTGWYDPWYYGPRWYDPWYYGYGWYDPWYGYYYPYGYRYGWYGGWGGWYYPVPYYTGVVYHGSAGHTGSMGYYDRSHYNRDGSRHYSGGGQHHPGSAKPGTSGVRGNTGFGSRHNSSTTSSRSYDNSSFGSTRSTQPSSTHSNSSFGSSHSNSSFGSSHSSGSFGGSHGGGSRGGGGSFGGSRGGGRR